MNITITGNLGSGKTSVCKELEKSGFTIISAGGMFREIAAEKGMSVIELNEAAKKDRSIDDMLDRRSTQLGKKMDNTVFDSRMAWHFVERSFKVFLLVDTQEAARRVFDGMNRSTEVYQNIEAAKAGLESRARLEQDRFRDLYGIDYYDAGNYDLIIESSCASPQQIAQEIKRNFDLYQAKPFSAKVELNLKCLYPAAHFADEIGRIEREGRIEKQRLAEREGLIGEKGMLAAEDFSEGKKEENKISCADSSFGIAKENKTSCADGSFGTGKENKTSCADGSFGTGKENKALCADGSFRLVEKDGYHYLVEGYGRVLAAIAAGQVFAQVTDIQTGKEARELVTVPTAEGLAYFEQAGGFCYPSNPVQVPEKSGYMIDFSRVFQGK